MNETAITQYIIETFPEVETSENFGYTFVFLSLRPQASVRDAGRLRQRL